MNHHELGDRGPSCIGAATEMDGKLRNPQRRRVPVAVSIPTPGDPVCLSSSVQCSRCRKRKIKCSGDTGDGQGCTNCRSAGPTAGNCQFLRVSPSKLSVDIQADQVSPSKVNSEEFPQFAFPYPCPEPASMVPSGWRGVGFRGKQNLLPMGSSQGCADGFQRSPSYDMVVAGTQVYPRSMGLDSIHYEDEPSGAYGHSSGYSLPGTPAGAMADYGASPWSPETWNTALNGKRVNGNIYPDPEAISSLGQSPYSFMLPSQGLSSADLSQSSSAVVGTVSSPDALGSDRTLPTPTSRGHPHPGNVAGMGVLPTEGMAGLPLLSDFKSPFWNPRCGTSPDQRATPTHVVPSNAHFDSASPPDVKCTRVTNAPELMFTYPPVPSTTDDISPPLSSTTIPSSTGSGNPGFPILDTLDSSSSEYGRVSSDTRLRGSFSRDHSSQRLIALANECTPEIYGYTSSEKNKTCVTDSNDRRCSAATLMNGLPYTRVRHQDPPSETFSFNLLPNTLPEYHHAAVENLHRPPVSPLGNHSAY
ncbi:hypothetical protein N7512_003858 [Penicillium capsulatum]|nr:hypothetical protein N7512_003858 [Penicillium capsulatum]